MELIVKAPLKESQTVTYATLTFLLLVHAYNCRVLRKPFWTHGFFKNYFMHLSILFGAGSIFLTIYIAFLRDVFHQGTPGGLGWGISVAAIGVFMLLSEIYKLGKRIYFKKRTKKQKEMKGVTVEGSGQ